MKKKMVSILILLVMLLQVLPAVSPEGTAAPVGATEQMTDVLNTPADKVVKSQKDYNITAGVTESHIVMTDPEGNNQVYAFMATISPTAKVTFKVNYPGYYTAGSTEASRKAKAQNLPFSKKRVTLQAADYTAATGENVLFATNSDMANLETYQSRGCIILEGNLVQRSDVDDPEAYFAILKDGTFDIRGYDEPYHDVENAASGRQWLVKDGVVQRFGDKTLAPRNAIGIKADGTVMTFVVDGRQSHTVGTTLREMAAIMYAAGCVEAVALDGGGSATFASRRNTTGALTLRNSPSDETGEREVTTSLLLIATDCRHTYTVGAPSIDNSHIATCTQCAHAIRMPHTYRNGSCICGAVEHGDGELYFGFDNDHLDRPHYNSPAYQYTNFDTPAASNSWFRSFWSTNYNGSAKGYTINNTTGTLAIDITTGHSGSTANGNLTYGPWLRTTTKYGVFPGNLEEDSKYHALSYDPSQAEFLRIRFKLENCVTDTGKEPKVVLAYHYKKNGTFGYGTDVSSAYSYTDGVYQTLTIPLSATFKNADVITNIGFRFQNIYSSSGGKLVVDYIYFGKNQGEPLFFDFTGDQASRLRYAAPVYTYHNFDAASTTAWATHYNGAANGYTIDNTTGVIAVNVNEGHSGTAANGNVIYGPWLKPTKYNNTMPLKDTHDFFPLMYQPSSTDYFQIRFKTEGCVADTGKTPQLVLEYYYLDNGVRNYANDIRGTWTVTEGRYVTLTVPAGSKFTSVDLVEDFGLRFQHVKSSTGGKLVIDYIYVGPRNQLPATDHTVTFRNWDGVTLQTVGVLKGETAAYIGASPARPADMEYHYSFAGWDKTLTNITADTLVTAQFTSAAHGFTYTGIDASTHLINCKECGYSAEASHSYTDGFCICGEKESMEPIEDTSVKLYHSLNLASDIAVNYVVPVADLEGCEDLVLEVQIPTYEGNSDSSYRPVPLTPEEKGQYYYFTLEGLTAVQMNDELVAVLRWSKNGQEYYSSADRYSVTQYAYNQLNKETAGESLKRLCADLLVYGTKAQIYKDHRTEALADAAMTEEQREYCRDLETVTFGNTNSYLADCQAPSVTWVGKSMNLGTKVSLLFVVDPVGFEGEVTELSLHVTYIDYSGREVTEVITEKGPYTPIGGTYVFDFDGLMAAELRKPVTVAVYAGETQVSESLLYSADTYGNGKTGALGEVCKALFAYADSARAYFAQ